MNPGLEALCADEAQRRQQWGLEERLTPPPSPPKGKERSASST
jgi:hypothetical protein